ncbi:MAG: hypothetical protein ACK5UE_01365, partial [Chitinophagales bacterium]
MSYHKILEEELKNKVASDYFYMFDSTRIIGKVDFCISMIQEVTSITEQESLLWAEAKKGSSDIYKSIVQLILTIGKARTFDKYLPPPFLGALDADKIAFIPYNDIHDIFYQNDFNWTVAPSNHETKEFQLIFDKVKKSVDEKSLIFHYDKDSRELKKFIKENFKVGKFGMTKTKIDKNNFMVIYNKWLVEVKPTIAVNWDIAKKTGIIDGDFYLADILSRENNTLKDKLFVLLKNSYYELERKLNEAGMFSSAKVEFNDNQLAHTQFWNRYDRPPKEEYWDYIVERRDLLVPQDVRERKGSFFTPQIWVELSQKYLTDYLGENWQDEYYIWDCASGTGNLLNGLTNKYNIYASTLDRQDVEVMHDRIKNGANLLDSHVFQFDFLNDDFSKLPKSLQDIINDPEKRKKLVVYINPPYAETANNDTKDKERINKRGVSFTKSQLEYGDIIGIATKELFAQFLTRIYDKLPNAILAQFSKLKIIQGPNFSKFRNYFKANYLGGFICQANTFDNVKGNFPIGFMIWSLDGRKKIEEINCEIFDNKGIAIGKKIFYAYDDKVFITDWYRKYHNRKESKDNIGSIGLYGSDFQHSNFISIYNVSNHPNRWSFIGAQNLIETSIYFTVRHCIDATWLNDRDQFLYPNDNWEKDIEFQRDCFTYTLFSNNIQSKYGTNHWIPFTEEEVNAKERFESHFMTDFISSGMRSEIKKDIFNSVEEPIATYKSIPKFSDEAKAVFDAGRALWTYYHEQPNINVNASLYDIREHFQGRKLALDGSGDKGKMNNKSQDEKYNILIANLRARLKDLAKKIEPKVYE